MANFTLEKFQNHQSPTFKEQAQSVYSAVPKTHIENLILINFLFELVRFWQVDNMVSNHLNIWEIKLKPKGRFLRLHTSDSYLYAFLQITEHFDKYFVQLLYSLELVAFFWNSKGKMKCHVQNFCRRK